MQKLKHSEIHLESEKGNSFQEEFGLGWINFRSASGVVVKLPEDVASKKPVVQVWSTRKEKGRFTHDERVILDAELLAKRPCFSTPANGSKNFFGINSTTISREFILFQFVALQGNDVLARSIPFCLCETALVEKQKDAALAELARLESGQGQKHLGPNLCQEWEVTKSRVRVDDIELKPWVKQILLC